MQDDESQGGLVTSEPVCSVHQSAVWLRHPGILLHFWFIPFSLPLSLALSHLKFSALFYMFQPHWCDIYCAALQHIQILFYYSQIFQVFPVVRCLVFASFCILCFLLSIQTIFHPSSTMHHHPALLLHALFPALHPAHIAPMYEVQG